MKLKNENFFEDLFYYRFLEISIILKISFISVIKNNLNKNFNFN